MKARNQAELNMYHVLIDLCDGNLAIIALILAFSNSYNAFKTIVAAIMTSAALLEAQTGGYVVSKKVSKQNLATLGSAISGRVYAYASVQNDAVLKDAMSISFSAIFRASDDEVILICNNIYSTANGLIALLADYGVTPAILLAFQNAITDYGIKSPKPKASRNQKKATRALVQGLFKDAAIILKEQMDKLVGNFLVTNPEFVGEYFAARGIIDPGSFDTLLKILVVHSITGEPVKNVKSYMDASAVAKKSSKKGYITYKDPDEGSRRIELSHKNFKPVVIESIAISHGHRVTKVVAMEPVVYAPDSPESPVKLQVVLQVPANSVVNVPYSFTLHDDDIVTAVNPVTSEEVGIGFGPDATHIANEQSISSGFAFTDTVFGLGYSLTNTFLNFRNATAGAATIILTIRKA